MSEESPERPNKADIKNFPAHAQFQWRNKAWYVYFPYSFKSLAGTKKQERDYIGTIEDGPEFKPSELYELQGCPKWEERPARNWKDPVKRAEAFAAAKTRSKKSQKKEQQDSLDKNPTPNAQLSVGATAMAVAALEDMGVIDALAEVLPEQEDVIHVANLAVHAAITSDKTYCASTESEVQKFIGNGCLTSPRASELLKRIGSDSSIGVKMGKACVKHVSNGSLLAFDGTMLPSYSKNINLTKLGKTKEGTFNTQVNVSLVVDAFSGIPVCYRTYAGNVNDISTLSDHRRLWQHIGLADKNVTFCADRGYLSTEGAVSLCETGFKFLIGAKTNIGYLQKIIDDRNTELYEPSNLFKYCGDEKSRDKCYYGISEATILKTKDGRSASVTSYICRSTSKQEELISNLNDELEKFEKSWNEKKTDIEKGEYRKCSSYDFFEEVNGKLIFDKNYFNEKCYKYGIFALVGNENKSIKEVLDIYNKRDTVEVDFKKIFGTLLQSTRVHSTQAFEGLMLVTFVALSILTRLSSRMKETIPHKTSKDGISKINSLFTLPELLRDFRRIKLTYDENGEPRVINVTKKDHDIVAALGFPGLFKDPRRVEQLLSADALIKKIS